MALGDTTRRVLFNIKLNRKLREMVERDNDTVSWLREMARMSESPDVARIGEVYRRRAAQQARRARERGELQ